MLVKGVPGDNELDISRTGAYTNIHDIWYYRYLDAYKIVFCKITTMLFV